MYEGKIPRTSIKALEAKMCEEHGPKYQRSLFSASRKLDEVSATLDAYVVVEVR